MSKQIDERVVSMQFDNKHFESNVSRTMSTLDKLKQKLNLNGAAKGLDGVNTAAKKVNMSGLSGAVDTVQAKFSALEVIGVTALANITNQAVNAGKRMVSALTIDPIKSGFQEYETQMNAVQTILANTSSKGSTLDDVNTALEELNKYADMTIYNFTEMTRNIGTFTAAGVDLDTSVNAIQGIANLAAVSGSNSQQASTAMYQLSQALAAGTVKLMDWNSVVNAGMGGEIFQNALKETSELLGTGAEAAIAAEGSFRESLTTGWLTSEVLTETLKKFTAIGANERVAEYTGLSVEAVEATLKSAEAQYGEAEAIEYASKALAEKSGKNADEIKETLQFAKTAQDAATKVKTFTQLWDVMKEAAQSGWSQTWKIIVGDFEEAKNLLTPLADFFTGVIGKMSDARNKLLEGALGKGFASLGEKISSITAPMNKAMDAAKNATKVLDNLDEIVNKVIRGDFGNGRDRLDALTKAGINYYEVQNKVNEELGATFRYSEKRIQQQKELLGTSKATTDQTAEQTEETRKLTEEDKNNLKILASMTEEQMESAGYTKEQVAAIKELGEQADKLGIPLGEFIDNLDRINGRWLLINSFKNIGQGLVAVITAIKDAWIDVFPPMTSDQLFNIIAGLHKFTTHLKVSDETADKVRRTFKGLFAALDIALTVVGGPLRIAFKILTEILGMFNLNIWDVTAVIGDAIVGFRDFIDGALDFSKTFERIIGPIKKAVTAVREWIESLKESENLPHDIAAGLGKGLGYIVHVVTDFFHTLIRTVTGQTDGIGDNLVVGFVNGVKAGISKLVPSAIEFGKTFLDSLCATLGINSPSKETFAIGQWTIEGFVNGIANLVSKAITAIGNFGKACLNAFKNIDFGKAFESIGDFGGGLLSPLKTFAEKLANGIKTIFGNIDWGKVLAFGLGVGMLLTINRIVKLFESFTSPLESLSGMLDSMADMFETIGESIEKNLKAKAFEKRARGVLKLAIAVGILAVAAYLLSKVPATSLLKAGIAVAGLVTLVSVLGIVAKKIDNKAVRNIQKMALTLLPIAGALFIVAIAMQQLAAIPSDSVLTIAKSLGLALASLVILLASVKILTNSRAERDMHKVGFMLLLLSASLLVMVEVIKRIDSLDERTLVKGLVVVGALSLFIKGLVKASKYAGEHGSKAGAMVLKISVALLIMVGVVKLAAKLDKGEIKRGLAFVAGVELLFAAVIAISKLGGEHASKAGGMIFKMSLALAAMVGIIKLISYLKDDEIKRGLTVITTLGALFAVLIAVSHLAGENANKAGVMLLLVSGALLVLTGVMFILSQFEPRDMYRALAAVTILGLVFTAMIAATECLRDLKMGPLVILLTTIAALVISVALLTMIDPVELGVASASLSALMGMFAVMTKSLSSLKFDKGQVGRTILALGALTLVMSVMTAVLYALGSMEDPKALIPASAALSLLLLSMSGAMRIVSSSKHMTKEELGNVAKTLLTLSSVLLIMAGILILMSFIPNPMATIPTAVALSTLLLALSAATLILGHVKRIPKGVIPTLLGLSAVVAILAVILGTMSALNIEASMNNVLTLSTLLYAMSGIVVILSLLGNKATKATSGVFALTLMAAPLVAFAWIMATMPPITVSQEELLKLVGVITAMTLLLLPLTLIGMGGAAAIIGVGSLTAMVVPLFIFAQALSVLPDLSGVQSNVNVLVKLMTSLTTLLVPLTLIGLLGPMALIGVIALTSMIIPLSTFAIGLAILPDVTPAVGSIMILNKLMDSLADILVKISLVAPLALLGVVSLTALGALMVGFGAFATTVGAFMTALPFLEDFLNKGVDVMVNLAQGIGQIIGAFVKGFAIEVMSTLPLLGLSLSLFMLNAMPFVVGIKMVDESVLVGIGYIAAAILALSAADFLAGLGNLVGVGLPGLGNQLSQFMDNLMPFIEGAKLLDPNMMTAVESLANTLLTLTGADLLSQLTSWFGEGASLAEFGAELAAFGPYINSFATSVSGLSEESLNAMKISAEAGKTLAEMAKIIPNSGGWMGAIFGENDAGDFGEQLSAFGTALKGYGDTVVGLNTEAIENSIPAAKALAELADSIPNVGGMWAEIVGDNDMATWGNQLWTFGRYLRLYGIQVTDLNTDAIEKSVPAAQSLSDLAAALPNSGGVWGFLAGDNDMATWGEQLFQLGRNLYRYGIAVTDLETGAIASSVKAVHYLSEMAEELPKQGGFASAFTADNDLSTFGSELTKFGGYLSSYSASVEGVNTTKMASITTQVSRLSSVVEELNSDGLGKFGKALYEMARDGIDTFIDQFKDSYEKAKTVGQQFVEHVSKGMKAKTSTMSKTLTTAIGDVITSLKSKRSLFYDAGKYLVEGFAAGISANKYKAEAKARAMAAAAANAAKDELDEHSPSKVGYQIGDFFGLGFVNALAAYSDKAYDSSAEMAESARFGLSDAIKTIQDLLTGDLDMTPTIRPVLDLSDIRSNASAITGLLNSGASVHAISNAGAINVIANGNRQNGVNGDVVSAIDKLGKKMNNLGNTTYNSINGITYDDGSNVAAAIEELVRYATIGGRT